MTYEAFLDLSVVVSALALVVIAKQFWRIANHLEPEKVTIVNHEITVDSAKSPTMPAIIPVWERGDRVRIKPGCFSAGMCGTVEFQEPGHDDKRKCWVHRDGSGGVSWFYNTELIPLNEKEENYV